MPAPTFQHVHYAWDDAVAAGLGPVERLVYRSNLLGSDQRVTNTGGGNTSSKLTMLDPLSGDEVTVLWVKGSGGDLRTAGREHFASLYLDKLLALRERYLRQEDRGPKSAAEDAMVAMYPHTTYGLNARASSIDTPLHAFVPFRHVDHTHPNAVIALAAAEDGEALSKEIYGETVAWLPWQRPGFDLGLRLQEAVEKNPELQGAILGGHGLINWADDDQSCYRLSLELTEKAAVFLRARDQGARSFGGASYQALGQEARASLLADVLPRLRGMVSAERKLIGTVQTTPALLAFANSEDAPRLAEQGTSCPDHFLRTKIKPLYVPWHPGREGSGALLGALASGLARYREDYARYYQAHRRIGAPAMRDPNPTVIVIPGVGLVAWGKTKSESRVTAEFYTSAVEVMRGAEAVSRYLALPQREAFDIEYWALEEAKLQRMPPEQPFAREVVVVIGAGSGIGRAVAARFAAEGAHVVCADLDASAARAAAQELTARYGQGIGVAGSGLSASGPALGLEVDVTRRESVRALVDGTVLAYGGIDHVVVTAGIFVAPDQQGRVPDEAWARTYSVNVTGAYLVADEARRVWEAQGLRGSLVITTSVNGAVAKRGSLAYDSSKAAANHLVRELAVELAPLVRVNGLAPATVVAGSNMFPRARVIGSLRKYGLDFSEDEPSETLRARLADFYAQRSLTKRAITPEDQAEAALLLASERLGKTTGQILNVDGGLVEAFLR